MLLILLWRFYRQYTVIVFVAFRTDQAYLLDTGHWIHMSEHQYYMPGQQPRPDSVFRVALWFNAWASPQTPTRVINIPVSNFLTQQLNNTTLKTHFKFNLRKRKMFQYIKGCYRQFFKEGRITSICWKEFYLCPGVNELWLGRKAALTGRWGSQSHPQLDDIVSLSLVAPSD